MKRVMNWLRTGPHRVAATAVITSLLILLSGVLGAKADSLYDGRIMYVENALFLQKADGGKWMCLIRGMSQNEYHPTGWSPVTCTEIQSPMDWKHCWTKDNAPIMVCGKPEDL